MCIGIDQVTGAKKDQNAFAYIKVKCKMTLNRFLEVKYARRGGERREVKAMA